jgi:ketosteroid isomerase-like protein
MRQDECVMARSTTESRAATEAWVAQLFASIDAMDTDAIVAHFADDAMFRFGNAEPARGRTAIREALAGFFGAIGGLEHVVTGVWRGEWERGLVLSVETAVTYTRADGSQTPTLPATSTLRLEGELIQDYRIFVDVTPLFAVT